MDKELDLTMSARYVVRKFDEWCEAGGNPNPGLCLAMDQLNRVLSAPQAATPAQICDPGTTNPSPVQWPLIHRAAGHLEARPDLETALRMFAAGCISGNVAEWPQLKPAMRWAVAEIDRLRKLENQAPAPSPLTDGGAQ